jgi:hypothetical protein
MELTLTIKKGFLGFGRNLEVTARDRLTGEEIDDPYVGKQDNHPGLDLFRQALDDDDD